MEKVGRHFPQLPGFAAAEKEEKVIEGTFSSQVGLTPYLIPPEQRMLIILNLAAMNSS